MLLRRRKKTPGVLRPSIFSGGFFLATKHYKNTTAIEPSPAPQTLAITTSTEHAARPGFGRSWWRWCLPESTAISRFRRAGALATALRSSGAGARVGADRPKRSPPSRGYPIAKAFDIKGSNVSSECSSEACNRTGRLKTRTGTTPP